MRPELKSSALNEGVQSRDLNITESILEEAKKQFLEGRLESSRSKLKQAYERLEPLGYGVPAEA